MNVQSWMIKSWATLEWYLPPQPADLPPFKHVGTQIRDDGGSTGTRCGDTVWMAQDGQWPAGLAWEWVEVKPGIVMLADPNSIITNLQLVDEQQKPVLGLNKTVAVNRLVHALAWQGPVCAALLQTANSAGVADTAAPARRYADPACTDGPRRLASRHAAHHPAPGMLRWTGQRPAQAPAQNSDQHSLQPRRAHTRATDREMGLEAPATPDLRRAA